MVNIPINVPWKIPKISHNVLPSITKTSDPVDCSSFNSSPRNIPSLLNPVPSGMSYIPSPQISPINSPLQYGYCSEQFKRPVHVPGQNEQQSNLGNFKLTRPCSDNNLKDCPCYKLYSFWKPLSSAPVLGSGWTIHRSNTYPDYVYFHNLGRTEVTWECPLTESELIECFKKNNDSRWKQIVKQGKSGYEDNVVRPFSLGTSGVTASIATPDILRQNGGTVKKSQQENIQGSFINEVEYDGLRKPDIPSLLSIPMNDNIDTPNIHIENRLNLKRSHQESNIDTPDIHREDIHRSEQEYMNGDMSNNDGCDSKRFKSRLEIFNVPVFNKVDTPDIPRQNGKRTLRNNQEENITRSVMRFAGLRKCNIIPGSHSQKDIQGVTFQVKETLETSRSEEKNDTEMCSSLENDRMKESDKINKGNKNGTNCTKSILKPDTKLKNQESLMNSSVDEEEGWLELKIVAGKNDLRNVTLEHTDMEKIHDSEEHKTVTESSESEEEENLTEKQANELKTNLIPELGEHLLEFLSEVLEKGIKNNSVKKQPWGLDNCLICLKHNWTCIAKNVDIPRINEIRMFFMHNRKGVKFIAPEIKTALHLCSGLIRSLIDSTDTDLVHNFRRYFRGYRRRVNTVLNWKFTNEKNRFKDEDLDIVPRLENDLSHKEEEFNISNIEDIKEEELNMLSKIEEATKDMNRLKEAIRFMSDDITSFCANSFLALEIPLNTFHFDEDENFSTSTIQENFKYYSSLVDVLQDAFNSIKASPDEDLDANNADVISLIKCFQEFIPDSASVDPSTIREYFSNRSTPLMEKWKAEIHSWKSMLTTISLKLT